MKNIFLTLGILLLLSTTQLSAQAVVQNPAVSNVCKEIAAQEGGIQRELERSIVPCGRAVHQCTPDNKTNINILGDDECEFRHLFVLVNNLVESFITNIFAPMLVIILMYIGFLFIKEQAAAKVKAKALLLRVIVGTFFVLGAWLIVNFLLSSLGVDSQISSFLK